VLLHNQLLSYQFEEMLQIQARKERQETLRFGSGAMQSSYVFK
jgi:hypothetical protein